MKFRRHHNNKGLRKIKRGKLADTIEVIAKKLGIPYDNKREVPSWWLEATKKRS